MKQAQALAIVAVMLLAGSAVSAQKITTEFDQNADFSRYRTFALRGGQLNSRNPALNGELVRKRIESDIERALAAKGLTQTPGRADLVVRYHLGLGRGVAVERYPAGWRGLGTRAVRVPYAEGTLVINLRDAATKSLVWRSIATEQKKSGQEIARKLDDMVRKSFNKYPPKRR
jgi:Domain of unknown function (DUF4136)